MSPSWTGITYSHSKKDIQQTLEKLESTCKFIQKNTKNNNFKKLLEGNLPKSIWSMKIKPTKKKNIKDQF